MNHGETREILRYLPFLSFSGTFTKHGDGIAPRSPITNSVTKRWGLGSTWYDVYGRKLHGYTVVSLFRVFTFQFSLFLSFMGVFKIIELERNSNTRFTTGKWHSAAHPVP